eukprot:5483061-Prymnesium_polylepis.2
MAFAKSGRSSLCSSDCRRERRGMAPKMPLYSTHASRAPAAHSSAWRDGRLWQSAAQKPATMASGAPGGVAKGGDDAALWVPQRRSQEAVGLQRARAARKRPVDGACTSFELGGCAGVTRSAGAPVESTWCIGWLGSTSTRVPPTSPGAGPCVAAAAGAATSATGKEPREARNAEAEAARHLAGTGDSTICLQPGRRAQRRVSAQYAAQARLRAQRRRRDGGCGFVREWLWYRMWRGCTEWAVGALHERDGAARRDHDRTHRRPALQHLLRNLDGIGD